MELKPGKIPENILKRSVLGKISGKRPEVLLGSGVGEDCCVLAHCSDEVFVMSTDPITAAEKNTGDLAVLVTANDLASAGAEPVGILLTVLLPVGTTEEDISSLMGEVTDKCRELSIEIMGGHTEITDVVKKPLLSVTGVGKCPKDRVITTGGAKPGMDLIVTKAIGLEGTSIIASEHRKELLTKLPADLIDRAASFINEISVVEDGLTAAAAGASAMHDVTEGGIYGGLWELAEASDVGLDCDLKKIPIRQETVEICEFYGIDPYRLISSGSMLIAAKDGNGVIEALKEKGIAASYIGRTTAGKDRVIRYDDTARFLTPPDIDELHKVPASK